jgi:hypothetical protein
MLQIGFSHLLTPPVIIISVPRQHLQVCLARSGKFNFSLENTTTGLRYHPEMDRNVTLFDLRPATAGPFSAPADRYYLGD